MSHALWNRARDFNRELFELLMMTWWLNPRITRLAMRAANRTFEFQCCLLLVEVVTVVLALTSYLSELFLYPIDSLITMDPNNYSANNITSGVVNNNSNNDNNNETSKRQAMTGQWRTPPLPFFASGTPQQPTFDVAPQPMPPQPAVPNIQLPESTDDYTKALQEAYRRGAEAAAALQQQHQQQMPNAVSCPNFHQLPPGTTIGGTASATTPAMTTATTAAPGPPESAQPVNILVPNPLAAAAIATVPADARSFSLPDMASYAARAQAEEAKRKKRLARNRASARVRRLRKKNLVRPCTGVKTMQGIMSVHHYVLHLATQPFLLLLHYTISG